MTVVSAPALTQVLGVVYPHDLGFRPRLSGWRRTGAGGGAGSAQDSGQGAARQGIRDLR